MATVIVPSPSAPAVILALIVCADEPSRVNDVCPAVPSTNAIVVPVKLPAAVTAASSPAAAAPPVTVNVVKVALPLKSIVIALSPVQFVFKPCVIVSA